MRLFAGSIALVLVVSLGAFVPVCSMIEPIRINGGLISGATSTDGLVRSFKGIPFAAPPVGDLRWREPQPVIPWSGVRQCLAFGPSPMQGTAEPFGPWSAEYLIPRQGPISEDCLYLNVWTDARAAQKAQSGSGHSAAGRPVLVWIYGGGFNSGGSAVPIYDGEAMARRGIVFISINYRVGPFGFLAHPELTKESAHASSGNYGLLDQIAALRWVKQNCAAFGGDPDNVTIAGQSAGSMSVNCLVASPLAKGLFSKAIAESGASFARPRVSLQQAEATGEAIMRELGTASLAQLRAKPAADILEKGRGTRGPVVDGYVLPRAIADIFAADEQNEVALLTGWNEDEGLAFGPAKSADDYRQQVEQQYGSNAVPYLQHYPATTNDIAAQSQRDASRDGLFGAQNYAWATIQSQHKKPVHVYRFTRKVPATGQYAAFGAFHTGEVAYAYDNLRFINRQLRPLTGIDTKLAQLMSGYWANFIKTGNPNGNGLPLWPGYTNQARQVMYLGDQVQARPLADAARLDFLLGLLRN